MKHHFWLYETLTGALPIPWPEADSPKVSIAMFFRTRTWKRTPFCQGIIHVLQISSITSRPMLNYKDELKYCVTLHNSSTIKTTPPTETC